MNQFNQPVVFQPFHDSSNPNSSRFDFFSMNDNINTNRKRGWSELGGSEVLFNCKNVTFQDTVASFHIGNGNKQVSCFSEFENAKRRQLRRIETELHSKLILSFLLFFKSLPVYCHLLERHYATRRVFFLFFFYPFLKHLLLPTCMIILTSNVLS